MKQNEISLSTEENKERRGVNKGYKTDPELGKKVMNHLKKMGVATPISVSNLSLDERRTKIETCFTEIMKALDLDLADDSLSETPSRIAKMYLNEIFYGLNSNYFPKCTTVENKIAYSEVVVERNIKVQSFCEHHFVPIDGVAHVGYIPKGKVIGLSKLNRVVDFFSRRPQIQERLAEQIFYALSYILETEDIAVMIKAVHFCVKSRGVEDVNSDTVTSKLGGVFLSEWNCRQEFLVLSRM